MAEPSQTSHYLPLASEAMNTAFLFENFGPVVRLVTYDCYAPESRPLTQPKKSKSIEFGRKQNT